MDMMGVALVLATDLVSEGDSHKNTFIYKKTRRKSDRDRKPSLTILKR